MIRHDKNPRHRPVRRILLIRIASRVGTSAEAVLCPGSGDGGDADLVWSSVPGAALAGECFPRGFAAGRFAGGLFGAGHGGGGGGGVWEGEGRRGWGEEIEAEVEVVVGLDPKLVTRGSYICCDCAAEGAARSLSMEACLLNRRLERAWKDHVAADRVHVLALA